MEGRSGNSHGDFDSRMLPPERRDMRPWIATPTRHVGHSSGCAQKPPLSVVIVKEQTSLDHAMVSGTQSVCSLESLGTHPCTTSPMSQLQSSASIIPSGAPFRLQPRGRSNSSPFSITSKRGQKRNAQCLTINSGSITAGAKRELFPSAEESLSFENSPQTHGERHPVVESAMESLSIKSPRVQHHDHVVPFTSSRLPSRSFLGSSFISYSSSPAESVNHIRPRADSLGSSTSSKNPNSPLLTSTKSSPRFAPVTILQKSGSVVGTPTNRPPLHGGPSSMMLPQHDESGKSSGDDPSRHVLDTPMHPPQSVPCSPPLSTVSTISKECTPAVSKRAGNPATPDYIPIIATPVPIRRQPHPSQSQMSPCTPASRSVRSAHDTPLPSVKLTPRSTPRSCAHSHRGGTSFTSPHSAWELGLLPIDLVLDTSSESREFPCGSTRSDEARNNSGNDDAGCQQLNPTRSCSSYLPRPDWSDDNPETCTSPPPATASFHLPPRVPMKPNRTIDEVLVTHGKQDYAAVHFTSLLSAPTMGGFFDELACEQARAAAMDTEGSLSDPDDEDPFILTTPSTLAEECQPSLGGPARQKQRLSYNSMEQYNHRASSLSLLSGHASNTSLLGVGFVRGDSGTSLSRPLLGNNRNYSMKLDGLERTDEEQGGPEFPTFGLGGRCRSDYSMASIGLELEPSFELVSNMEGRDLATPPAMEMSGNDPPVQEKGLRSPSWTPKARSVCISGSDPSAVQETIAMMAFLSGHDMGISPQTKCHS